MRRIVAGVGSTNGRAGAHRPAAAVHAPPPIGAVQYSARSLQHGFERAWSYWTFGRRVGVLAEHILVSATAAPRVVSSELLYELDGHRLAGRAGEGALSDHAVVIATLH